ncbi:MAG: MFS transporter [Bryobacterales bacterium]
MFTAAPSVLKTKSRRQGVYYGWANVAVAALAMVGTLPGRTQGLGLITEPLLADLHIDRVSYASINLWATLIGALFCLPCGRLVDRVGSRLVLSALLAALAATVLGMSVTSGGIALGIAITLSRGFGQSALSVASLALVGKWFGRGLNHAMGVYSLLVGVGFIAAFPSVGSAVLAFGWRAAWSGAGWALLLVAAPAAWLVVRNGPEDRGPQFDAGEATGRAGVADLTLPDALRSAAFWLFALSSSLFGLVYSGIALFNQSILEERGFDASVYHTVLVISTLLGLLANYAGGWLASRWPIQRVMGVGMALLSCALLMLPVVQTYTHVVLYGAAMGIAGGVVTVVFFSVWGQVYGRSHLGKIQGCAQMMTVAASAVGPLLLAKTLERTGSYDSIFYGLAAIVVALGAGSWLVPLPARKTLEPERLAQG